MQDHAGKGYVFPPIAGGRHHGEQYHPANTFPFPSFRRDPPEEKRHSAGIKHRIYDRVAGVDKQIDMQVGISAGTAQRKEGVVDVGGFVAKIKVENFCAAGHQRHITGGKLHRSHAEKEKHQ